MACTIDDLTTTLANALGLPRKLVNEIAGHLREAGLLPNDDAPAGPEHCAALLLGIMDAPSPERCPEMARLYGGLPLEQVTRQESLASGRIDYLDVPSDDPLVSDCRLLGDSLGEFLAHLIEAYSSAPEINVKPGRIVLCGGPGNASAMIFLSILVDGFDIGGTVVFNRFAKEVMTDIEKQRRKAE